jgi:hypothetical protein
MKRDKTDAEVWFSCTRPAFSVAVSTDARDLAPLSTMRELRGHRRRAAKSHVERRWYLRGWRWIGPHQWIGCRRQSI